MKTFLVVLVSVLAGLVTIVVFAVGGLTLWLIYGDHDLDRVSESATFEESARCLFDYNRGLADEPRSESLTHDQMQYCFPPQSSAEARALRACFNAYQRRHRGHFGWPADNMRSCTWNGRAPSDGPPLTFGNVVATPRRPVAGRPVVLRIPVFADGSVDLDEAYDDGTLEFVVLADHDPLGLELEIVDGAILLTAMPPTSAAGDDLTLELTYAHDTPAATARVVTYRVRS